MPSSSLAQPTDDKNDQKGQGGKDQEQQENP
jgi:hypothetical protein